MLRAINMDFYSATVIRLLLAILMKSGLNDLWKGDKICVESDMT